MKQTEDAAGESFVTILRTNAGISLGMAGTILVSVVLVTTFFYGYTRGLEREMVEYFETKRIHSGDVHRIEQVHSAEITSIRAQIHRIEEIVKHLHPSK